MKKRIVLSFVVGAAGLFLMTSLAIISLMLRGESPWPTWADISNISPEAVILALVILATSILLAIVARFFQRLMAMVQDLYDR